MSKKKQETVNVAQCFDSTSVVDLVHIINESDEEYLRDPEVLERVDAFVESASAEDADISNLLKEGKSILLDYIQQEQMAFNAQIGAFGGYALRVGKLLLAMKALAEKRHIHWSKWATENLPFLSVRTRQKYVLLAETEFAHDYTFLGLERVIHLISVTKGSKSDNPIHEFLENYNISFEPDQEGGIDRFKLEIDIAIALKGLAEADIDLNQARVREKMEQGFRFDKKLIKDLKLIKDNGGNYAQHFDAVAQNKGSAVHNVLLARESVKEQTARYVKTLDKMLADDSLLASFTQDDLATLEAKVNALKERMAVSTA
ncbi:hypothetical protein KAR91_22205 [Candidatus Pacearchaeota archaeon]|nr:hypothetical protein [Candidatus Pacearchaeota archaeon]